MDILLYLKTYLYGHLVGKDQCGNHYYQHKNNAKERWVIYSGAEEASAVPPEWHGFLHGSLDGPLAGRKEYDFMKEHTPNLTGTVLENKPKSTVKKTKNYKAWRPN